jgi:ubiquinone/menaquinone biosynthesis C-methylase UbiE
MEGWHGWDAYAPFYDWENARTVGRRDIPFWRRQVVACGGPVLELGCGTGRVLLPMARTGEQVVGLDRSTNMLGLARRRLRRARGTDSARLVRGDIRSLPFASDGHFSLVMAPYGVLQSLLRNQDLRRTLVSVQSVLRPGGTFAMELVPDVPQWGEYEHRVSHVGHRQGGSARISLVESVRQDRSRQLTVFEQEFTERRDRCRTTQRFSLTFRTLSMRQMTGRLRRAGFTIERLEGDYVGGPWTAEAETWLVVAHRAR